MGPDVTSWCWSALTGSPLFNRGHPFGRTTMTAFRRYSWAWLRGAPAGRHQKRVSGGHAPNDMRVSTVTLSDTMDTLITRLPAFPAGGF